MVHQTEGYLLLLWSEALELYRVDEYPTEGLVVGGVALKPHRPGKNLYLFDWLRCSGGEVCGVRFATGDKAGHLTRWLATRPDVREVNPFVFDIAFPGFSVDGTYSDEEQMVADDVLEGEGGSFALVLDAALCIEADGVRRLNAKGFS